MKGNKLINVMQQIQANSLTDNIIFGVVSGINPLKVKRDNQSLELQAPFLIQGESTKQKVIDYEYNQIIHKIIVNEGLKIGDSVILLKATNGQIYYILDKV